MAPVDIHRHTPAGTLASPLTPVSTPDASSTPSQTPTTQNPSTETLPTRTYRHRRVVLGVLSFAAVSLWVYHVNHAPSIPNAALTQRASAATLPSAGKPSPSALISSVLTQAKAYAAANGTYTGFTPAEPPGVLVGAAGPGMVVSVRSATSCLYSGVLPSGQKPVLTDATGSACTAAAINAARAALAREATASVSDQKSTLTSTATQVLADLQAFSLSSAGTFKTVPSNLTIAGVTILHRSSAAITVRITSGSSCETLRVPATLTGTSTGTC
jgi:hypothetical protein